MAAATIINHQTTRAALPSIPYPATSPSFSPPLKPMPS
jgi:hypothetical protein